MDRLALALLCACGASAAPSSTSPESTEPGPSIEWQSWEAAAFESARASDRMVLVDVGIEGCTACRWMYEDTYRNPEVVRRVRESFVAIAVDANERPDLGERYSRWGWPATIVLAPDGTQVLAIRGNKRPRNFIPILDELLERHRSGTLVARRADTIDVRALPDEGWEGAGCRAVISAFDGKRSDEAGWDRGFTMVRGAPIELAFLRAETRNDEQARHHALRTAEAYASLLDPVWGGVFVGGRGDRRIVEKRTKHNSAALSAFAHALRLTGDESWLAYAREAHRWNADWMMSDVGTFFATQEDDAPELPEGMRGSAYYRLDDARRRAIGIPPIDHAVYTDLNGRAIAAYVTLYEATRDDVWRTIAERAAASLLEERRQPEGWVLQSAPSSTVEQDDRMREAENPPTIFLAAQARFGWVLARLYNATGDARWLEAAVGIADASMQLLAAEGGGFHASPPDGTEHLVPRRLPVEDNATMARLLLWLASATREEGYRTRAEGTLRAITPAEGLDRRGADVVAELGLAWERLTQGPIEISIVADPDDPAARPLLEAATTLWEPRKVVHFEPDGRYPRQDEPIVHVCTSTACSSPISEPSEIEATVASLRGDVDDRCR